MNSLKTSFKLFCSSPTINLETNFTNFLKRDYFFTTKLEKDDCMRNTTWYAIVAISILKSRGRENRLT